jgi:peptide chain release factor subunit 3
MDNLTVICIGHVDAGKSTLCGGILLATGAVDERTIAKYKKEAKERNRESWFLAYVMDTSEEERERGISIDVGRANFATEKRRFTLLDAPGHKNYVPAMIAGVSHADVAILVVSARKNEFESGFDKQGQTREHALLAFTIGIRKLVVVVNKMDDAGWDMARFDEIVAKLSPYLKNVGYKVKRDVAFLPIAALSGLGVTSKREGSSCLLDLLEDIVIEGRDPEAPLRVTVDSSYADRGTWVLGKVESGTLLRNQTVVLSPSGTVARVSEIVNVEKQENVVGPGEIVQIKLDTEGVPRGVVLSTERFGGKHFSATIKLLEMLEHRNIFTAGYTGVLHAHTASSECVVTKIMWKHDIETGKAINAPCMYAKSGEIITVRIELSGPMALEPYDTRPALGRITIRDEGKSIAVGKVKRIIG